MTGASDSIHLQAWPEAGEINQEVLDNMARAREIITEGLALRMQKSDTEDQIKVRQPLASLTYSGDKLDDFYEQIIREEVNVKKVEQGDALKLDKTLTKELKEEGYARDLIRAIQSARKKAGLNMDDHIKLSLSAEIPAAYLDMVKTEVLADEIDNGNYAYDEIAKINGENVTISLERTK